MQGTPQVVAGTSHSAQTNTLFDAACSERACPGISRFHASSRSGRADSRSRPCSRAHLKRSCLAAASSVHDRSLDPCSCLRQFDVGDLARLRHAAQTSEGSAHLAAVCGSPLSRLQVPGAFKLMASERRRTHDGSARRRSKAAAKHFAARRSG